MITTLIFDIGGVLITPSEKITPFILSQMFGIPLETAVGVYKESVERLRAGQLTVRDLVEQLRVRYAASAHVPDLETEYGRYYKTQAIINTAVMDIIRRVAGRFQVVAFSNMNDLHVRCNRERDMFRYFRKVYLSAVTGLVKPSREAFDHLLGDLGISPEECFYVDDKAENTDAGTSLGMSTYLFDSAMQLEGYMQKVGLLS